MFDVRYIGKTCKTVVYRLKAHIREAKHSIKHKNTYKNRWIRSLLKDGITPCVGILEVSSIDKIFVKERQWIKCFRDIGCDLTNATDGGEGVSGHKFSDAHKEKLRQGRLGKKHSEEAKALMRESKQNVSQETREKQRVASTGRTHTEEHKSRMSELYKGKCPSDATIQAAIISRTGAKDSEETRIKKSLAQKARQEKIRLKKKEGII